ncbi:MAG: flagellar basal body-associated FliL family protein [Pirellulales bacterium]
MSGACWPAIVAAVVVFCSGCGSRSAFEFDALDMAPSQEELTEFSLGEYKIPIPIGEDRGRNKLAYRHRVQFDFELHALVSPTEMSHVADAWGRHEGKIRDQVIRVCRNATVDELQEPELATLKARLMDALASQIGEKEVQQLLISDVVSQEL